MKAKDLRPFETADNFLVSKFNSRGVAGYAGAYNSWKVKDVELPVLSIKYDEGVIMGGKTLFANVCFEDNNKKCYATIRFYENSNGEYVQNMNSVPNSLKFQE